MKRSALGIGEKSRERGSTFAKVRSELRRTGSLERTATLVRAAGKPKRKAISEASPAQRKKAREEPCVVTGQEAIYGAIVDPAHLCARAHGGCDDLLCVVPLIRDLHRAFDDGKFDLLPYLVGRRIPELQHALAHYDGNVQGLLHRLTGKRFEAAS